jgi:hypothetical protein
MDREAVIRELAACCRRDTWVCIWVVSYLTGSASPEALRDALRGAQEILATSRQPGHYEAYRERWGQIPDNAN